MAGAWPDCRTEGKQSKYCTKCNYEVTETIAALGHDWSTWQTVSGATVFAPELQRRTCSVCRASEQRMAEAKLAPSILTIPITLNTKSIPLKLKQSTTKVKVSNLAAGDYIASWKSSNTKIVTVNKSGKITAKNKAGKAVVAVIVAKTPATGISKVPSSVSLKKGKTYKLKAKLVASASEEKITYASSNKKVAVVDKNGKITGKKAGKAVITVKAGKVKVRCTVTVK